MVNFVNIPKELKTNASFCLWKLEKRSGKPTKIPYNPRTGQLAKTNDPSTFGDFNTAMKAYVMGGWDSIGYHAGFCSVGLAEPVSGDVRRDKTETDRDRSGRYYRLLH